MAIHATGVRTVPGADKEPAAVTKLFSKIGWRILPFLILCYMIAFLDRINIGYAQLQMKQTLTFSDADIRFRRRHILRRLLPVRSTQQLAA
jgi:sugar phosphate permease